MNLSGILLVANGFFCLKEPDAAFLGLENFSFPRKFSWEFSRIYQKMFQLIKSWRKFPTPEFRLYFVCINSQSRDFSINSENPGNSSENFLRAVAVGRHMEFPKITNLRIFPGKPRDFPGNFRNS